LLGEAAVLLQAQIVAAVPTADHTRVIDLQHQAGIEDLAVLFAHRVGVRARKFRLRTIKLVAKIGDRGR
jgi:hypothetical protein